MSWLRVAEGVGALLDRDAPSLVMEVPDFPGWRHSYDAAVGLRKQRLVRTRGGRGQAGCMTGWYLSLWRLPSSCQALLLAWPCGPAPHDRLTGREAQPGMMALHCPATSLLATLCPAASASAPPPPLQVAALQRQLSDANASPPEIRASTAALADLVGEAGALGAMLGCYSAKVGRSQALLLKQHAAGEGPGAQHQRAALRLCGLRSETELLLLCLRIVSKCCYTGISYGCMCCNGLQPTYNFNYLTWYAFPGTHSSSSLITHHSL